MQRSMIENMDAKKEMTGIEYELACRHFLMCVDGIGAATAIKIVEHYGCAGRIWGLTEKDIRKEQRMNERQKSNFIECRRRWDLAGELQKLKDKGIKTVSYDDRIYPGRLREIPDKPFLLYYIGELPSETMPCVAVIGARMCSEYGRFIAAELAAGLAKRGIQVVSGMADGIDGIAQRSALEHGGMSYGVLGCGVDVCYPASNRTLYQALQIHGGILSEFPPGTKPEARHFPMRNRIISGLADLILVIEAKERSGTRITVNMALEQGKEVYAVPGRITDELSRGCNRMILEGAGVAVDINELAEAAWQAWKRICRQVQEEGTGEISGKIVGEMAGERAQEKGKERSGMGKNEKREETEESVEREEMEEKRKRKIGEKRDKVEKRKEAMEAAGIDRRGKTETEKDMRERILQLIRKKGMTADEVLNCLLSQGSGMDKNLNISSVQGTLSELMIMGEIVCHCGLYEIKTCHVMRKCLY